MKAIVRIGIFGAIILSATPALASLNLVTNGGFESTPASVGSQNFTLGYLGNNLDGWTSTLPAYNILYHSATANSSSAINPFGSGQAYLWNSTASPTGGNFVALDGGANLRGPLTQTITGLTVGAAYQLTFDWGAAQLHSRNGPTTEQIEVSFGADTVQTSVLANASHGFTGWNSATFDFTATSTSQLLSFLSIGTPNGLPPIALLDSVSLTGPGDGAVPEPSTWAMMLLGFGLVGATARYRRRRVVAAAV